MKKRLAVIALGALFLLPEVAFAAIAPLSLNNIVASLPVVLAAPVIESESETQVARIRLRPPRRRPRVSPSR